MASFDEQIKNPYLVKVDESKANPLGVVSSSLGMLGNAYNIADSYMKNPLEASAIDVPTSMYGIAELSSMPWLESKTAEDFGYKNLSGDILSGIGSGAMTGYQASGNPLGAVVGAGIGGIMNFGAGFDRNAKAKREAEKYEEARKRNEMNRMYALNLGSEQIARDRRLDYERGFVFEQGGPLDATNGVTKFEAGGSHESNPNGGIYQGTAADGSPNLVEEGEVKWKDYIFPKRMKPTKAMLKQFNLDPKLAGKNYAEIATEIQKESESRPNTPHYVQTMDEMMGRLRACHEEHQMRNQAKEMMKMMEALPPEAQMQMFEQMAGGQPMGMPQPTGEPMQMPAQEQMPLEQAQPGMMEQPMAACGGRQKAHKYAEGGTLKSYKKKADIEKNLPWLKALYTEEEWKKLFDKNGNIIAKKGEPKGLYDPNGAYIKALNTSLNREAYGQWSEAQKQDFVNRLRTINPKTYADLKVSDIGTKLSFERLYNLATDGYVGGHHQIAQFSPDNSTINESEPIKYTAVDWTNPTDGSASVEINPMPLEGVTGNEEKGFVIPDRYNVDPQRWRRVGNEYRFDIRHGDEGNAEIAPITTTPSRSSEYPEYSLGPGIGTAMAGMLWTFNLPDYEKANALESYQWTPRDYTPIGDYLTYRPMDENYMANMLRSQAGATRRAIGNHAGPSTNPAMLAADYNAMTALGDTIMRMEEANEKNRQAVATFNRGTNQYNAGEANTAEQANFGLQPYMYGQAKDVAEARDAATTLASEINSKALGHAINGLGKVYDTDYANRQLRWLFENEIYPGVKYKN